MNGRTEPINEPHITTPTKLKLDGQGDEKVVLAVGVKEELPEEYANQTDGGEDAAERKPGCELTPDDTPPVAQAHFAQAPWRGSPESSPASRSCRRC